MDKYINDSLVCRLKKDTVSNIKEYCQDIDIDGVLYLYNKIHGFNVRTKQPMIIVGVCNGSKHAALSVEINGYVFNNAYELEDADINSLLSISVALMDDLTF